MLLKSNHTDALMDLKNNAHLTKYYLRANCMQGACARYWKQERIKCYPAGEKRSTSAPITIVMQPHTIVDQSLSRVRFFVTPWTAACQASLSIINSQSLLKLMSTESIMPSNHPILCHPLLLLPSIFPSIRVFSNESTLHIRWPKYWSFSINISPSNEYSGLISFRMDWLDSPCSPRDSQESSPTPQFKSINSSAPSFLYRPTLTSIHNCWKNNSFD